MKYAFFLASMVSYLAWWSWDTLGQRYSPDFELYTQGGIGLYPSPIGRALGALGPEVFAVLSVLATGAVVLFVYKAGGKWAASAIAFSPVTLYLGHAGIDPLGLVLYSAALAGIGPPLMLVGAAFTHTALVPFVLLEAVRGKLSWAQRALLLWFVGLGSLIVLVVTPYGGVVAGLLDGDFPLSFLQGLGAGVLIALPVLAVYRTSPAMVAALCIGAAECGLQGHLQARYLLPAAILGACTGTLRPRVTLLGDLACKQAADVLRTLGAGSSGARGGSSSPDYDEGGAISHVAPK